MRIRSKKEEEDKEPRRRTTRREAQRLRQARSGEKEVNLFFPPPSSAQGKGKISRRTRARFRSRRDGKINSVICVYIPPQYTSRFCLSSSPWRPSFPELWLPCKREPGIRVMHAGYLQWGKKKERKERRNKEGPRGGELCPTFLTGRWVRAVYPPLSIRHRSSGITTITIIPPSLRFLSVSSLPPSSLSLFLSVFSSPLLERA